jgi:hypothetical protein
MTNVTSDLAGPVDIPTGPTEGAIIAASVDDAPASVVDTSPPASADSIVGTPEIKAPAPVASTGETVLAIGSPWYLKSFDPSLDGCPAIASVGTPVPDQFVDQAISTGAANGVTIVKR